MYAKEWHGLQNRPPFIARRRCIPCGSDRRRRHRDLASATRCRPTTARREHCKYRPRVTRIRAARSRRREGHVKASGKRQTHTVVLLFHCKSTTHVTNAVKHFSNKNRGRIIRGVDGSTGRAADILVTVHPSFLLRIPDEDRDDAYARFVADLKLIRPYAV